MKKLTDSFYIQNIKLKNRLILAPMAGITDAAFRKLAINYGASLVVSEMISDHASHYENKKTDILLKNLKERPLSIQIFGSSVEYMVELAKKIDKNKNVDIIDINMGCPVPKVSKRSKSGSYYLQHPELIFDLVSEIVRHVSKPVTVKIRAGWDKEHINAVEVAKILEKAGVSAITVHGRTTKQLYTGKSDLEIIKKVKEAVSIPVIGNGDVLDYESAKYMLDYTNCDGIMIGRASLGRPYIFKKIISESKNKSYSFGIKDLIKLMKKHYQMLVKIQGEKVAKLKMKTHVSHYLKQDFNYKDLKSQYLRDGDFYKLINELNQK